MAAGLSIKESFFPDFQKIFNQTVQDWLNEDQLQGVIWTDGELQANEFSIETAEVIKSGGPWGQAFLSLFLMANLKFLSNARSGKIKII